MAEHSSHCLRAEGCSAPQSEHAYRPKRARVICQVMPEGGYTSTPTLGVQGLLLGNESQDAEKLNRNGTLTHVREPFSV